MNGSIQCKVKLSDGESGISMYMNEEHHYDLFIRKNANCYQVVKRSLIGGVNCEQNIIDTSSDEVTLKITLTNCDYFFSCVTEEGEFDLGKLQTRYLSSEVACGFTGVMIALYAQSTNDTTPTVFSNFEIKYSKN